MISPLLFSPICFTVVSTCVAGICRRVGTERGRIGPRVVGPDPAELPGVLVGPGTVAAGVLAVPGLLAVPVVPGGRLRRR